MRYQDPILAELEQKFAPKKVSPYFFEFIRDNFASGEVIAIDSSKILDLLVLDMEKIERRIERLGESDIAAVAFLRRCLEFLETEKPLCDMPLDDEGRKILTELAPLSFKPVVPVEGPAVNDINALIERAMAKAGVMFFYTAGKPEVHAWMVKTGSDIVTCAGKIHTDLARGFIKGEIINVKDYGAAHNLNDARTKGLTKLVDRDYVVQHGDVIEIRFNV